MEVGFNREQEMLIQKIHVLKQRILELNIEIDNILKANIEINATYNAYIGVHLYERYQLYFDCKVLKRKIEILQYYRNHNKSITSSSLQEMVQKEIDEYEQQLKNIQEEINLSEELLKSEKVSQEDLKEIKKIYRKIVKSIHPDVHPHQSNQLKLLWNMTQDAYLRNDLQELRRILKMIELENIDELEDNRQQLFDIIKQLEEMYKQKMEEVDNLKNSFPYNQREMLDDEEKRQEEIDSIKLDIEYYKELKEQLLAVYRQYNVLEDA